MQLSAFHLGTVIATPRLEYAEVPFSQGLGANRTNSILQSAFFALTKVIPLDMAVEDMKKNNYNSYFKKAGQKIVGEHAVLFEHGHRQLVALLAVHGQHDLLDEIAGLPPAPPSARCC
mgnify:CR=1 FL=1